MKPHRFAKYFESKANALWFVFEFGRPINSKWVPVLTQELRVAALKHAELLDGWVAIPEELPVFIHATARDRIEMRVRLGLKGNRKLIDWRGELEDLVDELGYGRKED